MLLLFIVTLSCQTSCYITTSKTNRDNDSVALKQSVQPVRPPGRACRSEGMAVVHDSISDFVLFPRDQSCQEMVDTNFEHSFTSFHYNMGSGYQHFSELTNSTYDSYEPVSAYSSAHTSYLGTPHLVVDAPKDSAGQLNPKYTPSASPSTSVSHSLEHPPSTLSSASGASVQSTASSTMGSPYSHATHSLPSQDRWNDAHHGLAIASGIAQPDPFGHDTFPLSGMDNEGAFDDSKYSDSFVGESHKVSSFSSHTCRAISSPPMSSCTASQSFLPASAAPPLVLDTSVGARMVTIDSILEEVNSGIDSPAHLISPASVASGCASPRVTVHRQSMRSPEQNSGAFKSPSTPASAMSPLAPYAVSPSIARTVEPRQHLLVGLDPTSIHGGAQSAPIRPPSTDSPVSPIQSHRSQFQAPFFNQSSGRFVAPLQSSCWFSFV